MILVECKNIPKIKETLIVSKSECILQHTQDEFGLLDEYIIDVAFYDEDADDKVAIDIDDVIVSLLSTHAYVKIFKSHLDFGDVEYTFKPGSDTMFETQVPQLSYISVLPTFDFTCDVVLEHTCIRADDGRLYKLMTLHEEYAIEHEVRINGAFLEPGFCKVYSEENSLVCFEYQKHGYIKRRFVAPIE
jgi:hypothetical protein